MGEDTRLAVINKQDRSIATFNPYWKRILQLSMTQEATTKRRPSKQESINWMCSNEYDSNQSKVIKSKRTCSKYSADLLPQTLDGRGMIYLSDKEAVLHHSGDTSLPEPPWEYRCLETDSGSFHAHHMPAAKPLGSTKHPSGTYNAFRSLRKYYNKMPHIYEQIPNQQLDESTTNASQSYSLESQVGTKCSYGLGHIFSKFSSIYSDISHQVFQSSWFSKLVGLCDKNEKYTQVVSCIKSFPFIKKMQLNLFLDMKVNDSHDSNINSGSTLEKEDTMDFLPSEISVDMCTVGCAEESSNRCRNEKLKTSLVIRQNFVYFSDGLLKLQLLPWDELLQYVTSVLPEICAKPDELKGIYWIAVGNYKKPGPQPACLLLIRSVLYALIPSANQLESIQDSLEMFHVLPIATLREIQIGYAGQSIRLLCSSEDNAVELFTFNKYFSQRICHDILSIVIPSSEYACLKHPLLQGDLLQLSVDWTSAVTDLVFESGVCLSCSFQANLANLLYLLHENMEINKPPLGDIQLLLYTTVKLEGEIRSLVLTNTHIGFVQEDCAFCQMPGNLHSLADRSQFDRIQLRCLSELKCVVVPEKENLLEVELVFSKSSKVGCDAAGSLPCTSQRERNTQMRSVSSFCCVYSSTPSCTWKLTFSSNEDAIGLLLHLTGQ